MLILVAATSLSMPGCGGQREVVAAAASNSHDEMAIAMHRLREASSAVTEAQRAVESRFADRGQIAEALAHHAAVISSVGSKLDQSRGHSEIVSCLRAAASRLDASSQAFARRLPEADGSIRDCAEAIDKAVAQLQGSATR